MGFEHWRVLMESFIESEFAYCPIVWMRCYETTDNLRNHLHEYALRTVYNDNL